MPEPKHSAPRRHRWTRFALGAAGGLFALLLVYPVWMPWLLKPLAAPFGIRFGKCTRHGYAAFEFSNVRWTDGSASVVVERLRLQTPHRWLWSRLRGSTGPDPQVRGDGWRVEVRPGDPADDGGLRSTAELLDLIQRDWPTAGAWIQSMLWTEGTLDLGQPPIAVPSLTWRKGLLSAQAFESQLALDLTSMAATGAELSVSNGLVVATIELRRDKAQWTFKGAGVCRSNRLQVSGSFDRSQWLPATAVLTADALHIAPVVPELGAVAELEGRGRAVWTNGAYHFDIHLENPPAAHPGETGIGPH